MTINDDADIAIILYRSHEQGRQSWRWRAVNARNNRKIANGGEAYVNEEDCVNSICALFGDESTIVLRRPNVAETTLRVSNK